MIHLCKGSCLVTIFCSDTLITVIRIASLAQTIYTLFFRLLRDINLTEEREVLNEKMCFLKNR